jgi:hypothetical protein
MRPEPIVAARSLRRNFSRIGSGGIRKLSSSRRTAIVQPAAYGRFTRKQQGWINNPAVGQPDNQTAGEQLKEEVRQRILGVLPNFNMVNSQNALPLDPKQKFQLMFKSSVDPAIFVPARCRSRRGARQLQGLWLGA